VYFHVVGVLTQELLYCYIQPEYNRYGGLHKQDSFNCFCCVLYRALGQGAFGEVYQGFFRHRAGDAVEMPVAVKVCQKAKDMF